MATIEKYILVTLFVLFAVVFVRWLKRFLHRNEIHDVFPYVQPFEGPLGKQNQLLQIELPKAQRVRAEVLFPNGDVAVHLFDEELDAGTQLKNLPTSALKSGTYELRITFENQVTRRTVEVL